MSPQHHVIIGDGATAAAFAKYTAFDQGSRLTIVGADTSKFARGLAYADVGESCPWRDAYLLNSPAESTDADFVDWARFHWLMLKKRLANGQSHWLEFGADHLSAGDYGALFWPRSIFGDFLEEQANAHFASLVERGVRVEKRSAIATSIAKQGRSIRITLQSGEHLLADSVDVATGGPANQRFGADAGATAFTRLYGNEYAIADAIKNGQHTVACVGANAAMLDVLRLLQSIMPESDIRMKVFSSRDSLPEPMIPTRARAQLVKPDLSQSHATVASFLQSIDQQIARYRMEGAKMYELRQGYRQALGNNQLAFSISNLEERRKVMPLLERRFFRGTHDSIADFERLRAAGQIEFVSARVEWIYARKPYENDARIRTASGELQDTCLPVVINTSGPGGQLSFDLVTSGMIRNGWLKLNSSHHGVVVGAKLATEMPNVRYLSPAVTEIGAEVLPFPLYDIASLKKRVENANT